MPLRRFHYGLGGFEIRSTFPLPGLVPGPSAGDALTIFVDSSDGPSTSDGPVLFGWPGRYGLTLRAHGTGWMFSSTHVAAAVSEDGRSVRCHPATESPGWPEVLVRRILPRLAQWHGRVALHAAAVADGDAGIVLLGPSGGGKSTLAAALCRFQRWRLLGDDISLVDGDAETPTVWPSGQGAGLWPDSLASFGASSETSPVVAGHTDKRWLDAGLGGESAAPSRLSTIVVLTPDDVPAVSIRSLAPGDAARRAGALMVSFNPGDVALVARSWAAVGRLVTTVPAFTLSYPRRYERLPEVASALSAILRDRELTPA